MRLKSLKLAGFKSFANPTTFTFKHNITAIVGPNGCGKSNIIDAVRWVLGETSAKQLRGTAMSDVIFSGADGRSGKSLASVDLTFEHTQDEKAGICHALNLYHELTLRRQITKEGKSDYFINGEKVRRRDVVDVFLGTGLGSKSYAVIEQGMIGRIVDSTPEELRAFIEEAAGVSRYQARREETQKQLLQASQNLDRLQDLQGELKKQQSVLQQQAKSAKTYQELSQKLDKLLWQEGLKKIFETWQLVEEKKQLQAITQKTVNDCQTKILQSKQQIDENTLQINQLLAQKDKAKDTYHDVSLSAQTLSHQYQELIQTIKKNQLRITQLKQRQESTLVQITKQLNAQQVYEQDLVALTPKLQKLIEKLQDVQKQFDDHKIGYQKAKNHLNQLFDEKQILQNAKNIAQNTQKQTNIRLDKWSKKYQNLQREQQNHVKKYADFDADELNLLKNSQIALQKEFETLTRTETDQERLQQTKQRHVQLQQEIYELEKQQISLQSEQIAINQWINDQKTHVQKVNVATSKEPVWTTLKQSIVLTKKGEQYANILDKFLQIWLDSAICDDLMTMLDKNGVHLTFNNSHPTSFLFKNQLSVKKNWHDTNGLVALDELIQAPQLDLFHYVFLLKNHDANLQDIAQMYRHHFQQGMMIFTPTGWLIGVFGILHVSHFQVINDEFLSKQIHHRQRLEQIQNCLDGLQNKLMDKKSAFIEIVDELHVLEKQQKTHEQTVASTTKEMHLVKEKITHLTLKMQQKMLHEENFAKNNAVLEDEKQELDKELSELADELLTIQERWDVLNPKLQQAQYELKDFNKIDGDLTDKIKQITAEINQLKLNQQSWQQQKIHAEHLILLAQKSAKEDENELQVLTKEQEKNQTDLPKVKERLDETVVMVEALKQRTDDIDKQLIELENQISDEEMHLKNHQELFTKVCQNYTDINTQIAVTTSRLTDLSEQMRQKNAQFDLNVQLADFAKIPPNFNELDKKIDALKQKITQLGAVNLTALTQLQELDEQILPMQQQIDDVHRSMMTLKEAILTIDKKTKTLFLQMLDAVNQRLNELFVKIFEGGQASLALLDDETLSKADKWRAGLVLMAQPKGKKNSRLAVLSGGEKTLTALSLVFAIFKQHPAPFCLLDEVDAPLDDANVGRFTSLIHELSADVQFIFISHNKLVMQAADELKGVTMPQAGISQLITVNLQEAQQYLDI